MYPHSTVRRRLALRSAALAVLASAALVTAGCSSTGTDARAEPTASGASYPVTVEHAYGESTVDAKPERVVTLGWMESDIVAALGVEPVAMSSFAFEASGVSPWLAEELTTTPELLDTTGAGTDRAALSLESIAALDPDLIVATSYIDLGSKYDELAKIAPVVGPTTEDIHHLDWRDEAEVIGSALGVEDEVAPLIERTDATIADLAAEHPELSGLDYTLALGTPAEMKVVNDAEDGSVGFFDAYGMTFAETAAALPSLADGSGAAGLSPELVSQMDADRVYVAFLSDAVAQQWQSGPVYPTLEAVQNGGVVQLTVEQIAALRNPSPLNAAYAMAAIAGS